MYPSEGLFIHYILTSMIFKKRKLFTYWILIEFVIFNPMINEFYWSREFWYGTSKTKPLEYIIMPLVFFMSHRLISIDLFCTVGFVGIQKLNLKFKFDKSVFSTHQTSYFTLRYEIQDIAHIIFSVFFFIFNTKPVPL